MVGPTNSKVTRVQPIFKWLAAQGGDAWPARLVKMAHGLKDLKECGSILNIDLTPERKVPPTSSRLTWMLKNAKRFVPEDGRLWSELRRRVANLGNVNKAHHLHSDGARLCRSRRGTRLVQPSRLVMATVDRHGRIVLR
jgi:hypothetical protein